jgi:hypothetical protein
MSHPIRKVSDMMSDNPFGADNQQETGSPGILRDCTRGVTQTVTMRQSDPHGDMGSRAEMTRPLA